MIKKFFQYIKNKLSLAEEISRSNSVDIIESEILQLEHVFSLLAFGQFVGVPSLPSHILFSILPESQKSISLLINRMNTQNDPLSELASIFKVD
jgi:hypothetical protein